MQGEKEESITIQATVLELLTLLQKFILSPLIMSRFHTHAFLVFLLGILPLYSKPDAWMKSLPDRTPLTQITIPGTHDSAALHEPLIGTAKCQHLTLKDQLDAGVRFLDLRCRHQNDQFHIYHGMIDQKLTFQACLSTMENFLKKNPSETIIVSIKEEHSPSKVSRPFLSTFKSYLKRQDWWLSDKLPTLGQVRGKMTLLRHFPAKETLGIPAVHWKCQACLLYTSPSPRD